MRVYSDSTKYWISNVGVWVYNLNFYENFVQIV